MFEGNPKDGKPTLPASNLIFTFGKEGVPVCDACIYDDGQASGFEPGFFVPAKFVVGILFVQPCDRIKVVGENSLGNDGTEQLGDRNGF